MTKMYSDSYSMLHDKPTDGINGSSNNRAIYTAYAKHIIPEKLNINLITQCYKECSASSTSDRLIIDRNPNQKLPPQSKDEIIGWSSLGYLDHNKLKSQHFTYCNLHWFNPKPLYKINWLKAIKQLWSLRGLHRNTIWQKRGYEEAMQLAFRLAPFETFYIKRMAKVRPSLLEGLLWHLWALQTVLNKKTDTQSLSTKNMLWLMLKDLNKTSSFYYKRLKYKQNFLRYFGEDHIFNK